MNALASVSRVLPRKLLSGLRRLLSLVPYVLLAAIMTRGFLRSWEIGKDVVPLVDWTYITENAYFISRGLVPYVDFGMVIAPGTPLAQGLGFALFGVSGSISLMHAAIGCALTVLFTALNLHALGLSWWGTLALSLPIATTSYVLFPYPNYDNDATLAVLVALFVTQRAWRRLPTERQAFFAGVAAGIPVLFKQNIGGFAAIAFFLVWAIRLRRNATSRSANVRLVAFALGGVLPAASLVATAVLARGPQAVAEIFYWTVTFPSQARTGFLSLFRIAYEQFLLPDWGIEALGWLLAGILLSAVLRVPWRIARCPTWLWPFVASAMVLTGWVAMYRKASWVANSKWVPWRDLLGSLGGNESCVFWAVSILTCTSIALVSALALSRARRHPTEPVPNFAPDVVATAVLFVTFCGAIGSQRLLGSTYANWPVHMILIAAFCRALARRPFQADVHLLAVFLGIGMYGINIPESHRHSRLTYVDMNGVPKPSVLSIFRGYQTPGNYFPTFDELVTFVDKNIPASDGVVVLPGEDPIQAATGRMPPLPVFQMHRETLPHDERWLVDEAAKKGVRWLFIKKQPQCQYFMRMDHPKVLAALAEHYRRDEAFSVPGYDLYRLLSAAQ